jgi:ubiquinone/menaquinone biosynthesis C-methylase UbiE
MPEQVVYTHGHHPSVLRSHAWRTAENSAQYLLKHIKPHMRILDVGCGPGTITVDLASLVPHGSVVGIDAAADILEQAKDLAQQRGLSNLTFQVDDAQTLAGFADDTFDVVHAHQILQQVGDPVQTLRQMRRVAKPGGIIAVRESDYDGFTWYPEGGLKEWNELYLRVARSNGGEPNAGRRLHVWARQAGFDRADITCSTGTWCYSTPEELAWWSELWADRTVQSNFARTAIERGIADQEKLEHVANLWREWGKDEDAWFVVLHGEIICSV